MGIEMRGTAKEPSKAVHESERGNFRSIAVLPRRRAICHPREQDYANLVRQIALNHGDVRQYIDKQDQLAGFAKLTGSGKSFPRKARRQNNFCASMARQSASSAI